MPRGTVKFFNQNKGFGFIKPDDDGKDIFVHANSITGEAITEGDIVTYDTESTKKGPAAINVNKS